MGAGGGLWLDLKHLDEGDGEVEISQVAADEAKTEGHADGHDSTDVDLGRHLDLVPAVKYGGPPRHHLRHYRGKDQVVGGQNDGVVCDGVSTYTASDPSEV